MPSSIVAMDASTARTLNIRKLVADAGGPTEFANRYGSGRWGQAQISQWISEDRPKSIGSRLARDLEAAIGLARGTIDQPLDSTSDPSFRRLRELAVAPEGSISIPHLSIQASMGTGALPPDHVEVVQNIAVNLSHLRRQVSFTNPGSLRFITGYGDSMAPTFLDGDPLLVDTGISDIKIDAVYVLELNNELYIKRLQRRPSGEILMISDNKNYEPYLIKNGDLEHFAVRGRVLLAWNARRL